MTLVAVCIPTFRRPDSLARLLESLTRLRTGDARLAVVVVDNDAEGSAKDTVAEYRRSLPDLVYSVEPERGISAARNRLLRLAVGLDPDYVAFVDDDEWVEETWLVNLLTTARRYDADAVVGPVLPSYEPGMPAWIREGRFFERARRTTGAPVLRGATGNTLIARRLLCDEGDHFPRCFPEGVGEDTYFFERARRAGARIVWCDEACVHELVPAARASSRWLIRRAYIGGTTFSRGLVLLGLSRRGGAVRTVVCLGRVVQGILLAALSVLRGRAAVVRALQRSATGAGGVVGLLTATAARGTK